LTGKKYGLLEIFEVLEPWTEKPPMGNKVVWVRCRGLPLNLWTEKCFKYITQLVGCLVKVDEMTKNWERLDFARLKLCLPVVDKAKASTDVKINGKVYWVSLEEERYVIDLVVYKEWCSDGEFQVRILFLHPKLMV